MKLQGIFIDAATPFDHKGALYPVKIEHNIAKWNRTSVAGYVVGGFAGEGALLSPDEKFELWRVAAAVSAGKILIAGVDAPGVDQAAAQINRAAAQGFAAALVETPHAEKSMSRPETQILYFRSVADRAEIPILISNRPTQTGVDLPAGTLLELSSHPNIVGVVEHSGKVHNLPTLCGSESDLWKSLTQRATGAVLSFASAAPYACIAVWEAHRTREEDAGLDWQSRIAPAAGLITRLGIAGLKHAMDVNGYYGGPPRLPWVVLDGACRSAVEAAIENLKS